MATLRGSEDLLHLLLDCQDPRIIDASRQSVRYIYSAVRTLSSDRNMIYRCNW